MRNESASLGWWDGQEFRTVPAQLKSVSLSGALISSEVAPPKDAKVWLCHLGSPPTDWVEVVVASVDPERQRRFRVRATFPESCPSHLFDSATRLSSQDGRASESVATEFDGIYWR